MIEYLHWTSGTEVFFILDNIVINQILYILAAWRLAKRDNCKYSHISPKDMYYCTTNIACHPFLLDKLVVGILLENFTHFRTDLYIVLITNAMSLPIMTTGIYI